MSRTPRRRPHVTPVDPQRAINRRWEDYLARRYPGTRWEIIRDNDDHDTGGADADGDDRSAGHAAAAAGPAPGRHRLDDRGEATGDSDDLRAVS